MRFRFCLAVALSAALPTASAAAQKGSAEVKDSSPRAAPLFYSDAVHFKTWSTGRDLFFEVEMKKPHTEGMYTCLHVYIDADGKPKTGIQGAEIWLRASIGSRFHPNSFEPKKGTKGEKAMDIRRASLSGLVRGRSARGGSGWTWLHQQVLEKPEIGAKTIRFKVPTSELRGASRYGSAVGVHAEVETTCSDQPLMLRHSCADDGITIDLDGRDGDWSHPLVAKDARDELHPVGQILDLTSLRIEHDANNLYACAQLAEEGLGRDDMDNSDVSRYDGVTFYVEPMYPRYQDPKRMFIRFGKGGHPVSGGDILRSRYQGTYNRVGGWRARVAGKTVELRTTRLPGQNEFRVWVWSDLRRVDRLPNEGWLKIDWGKPK